MFEQDFSLTAAAAMRLAPDALVRWFPVTVDAVVFGALAGVLIAHALRMLGLRWSCAVLAIAAGVVLRPAIGADATALATAGLVAMQRGRRLHADDLDAGADLAAGAKRRVGPSRLVLAGVRRLALRRRTHGDAGWFRGERLIIGSDERRALVTVPLGGTAGGTHMLVVGATGSGKTVTATWTLVRAIERGMGAVAIDPKGDRRMRDALAAAADRAGRTFVRWTPDGPTVYNPYARGGETEIGDKLLAGERFSEPHYLRQSQRYMGHVVRALRAAGYEVSLQAVAYHLDPTALDELVRDLPGAVAEPVQRYLDSLSPRQRADLAGVRDRLAIVAESDAGRWLDPAETGKRSFDLLTAVQARAVVYFDLAADRRPLLTQMLGAAIVQDLTTTVAALQHAPCPTVVAIDEFSSIAAEHVVRLFGRARSAGISLVLGTQELADLRLPGREMLLEQVLGNLSVVIAHRQVVPASAELIAGLAGTAGVWRTTRQDGGRVTRSRVRERALSADDVIALGRGSAVTIVFGDAARARIARIFSVDGEVGR